MVSVAPVPVVMVLPNWSWTVTPTEKLVPAPVEEAGCVVMASLLSDPAVMVKPVVVPLTMMLLLVEALAEIVGFPAAVSA